MNLSWPRVRLLGRVTAASAVLTVAAYLGAGWYYSGEIRGQLVVRPPTTEPDVRVARVGADAVTLAPLGRGAPALGTDAVYGLDWGTGFGQLGRVLGRDGDAVTRTLTGLSGEQPRPGQPARLVKDAFPDPFVALHLPLQEVTVASSGRELPAWLVAGPSPTWAVLVHGMGATRNEMLRLMRTTTGLGLPSLDITYRRDAENGGGLMRFGWDEWQDVDAAVRFALDHGAARVVLVGASSGASLIASFLETSGVRDRVAALVLDSPNLDVSAAIAHGASARRLPVTGTSVPSVLLWGAERLTGLRIGVDFPSLDYVDAAGWLTVPTRVLHGTADTAVPVTVSRRFEAAHPRLVHLDVVEGAGHVESWNVDPARYDARVRGFLAPFAGTTTVVTGPRLPDIQRRMGRIRNR